MKINVKYVLSESVGVKWTEFKREAGVEPRATAHGVYRF